jgi:hypothetical protein
LDDLVLRHRKQAFNTFVKTNMRRRSGLTLYLSQAEAYQFDTAGKQPRDDGD